MFSRLQNTARLLSRAGTGRFVMINNLIKQDAISKRWSGHNAMMIEPSNYGWKHFKDMIHLYTVIMAVPMVVITTIINIRANPELSEIPEGYEPRHWEYYKSPVTRFMAKYFYIPMELDEELSIALMEFHSESKILRDITKKAMTTMKFYNDHRTKYFQPWYGGDYLRIGRDVYGHVPQYLSSSTNLRLHYAYDPEESPIPVEGYIDPDYDNRLNPTKLD